MSRPATLDDLVAWTMPSSDVAPGLGVLGESLALEVAKALGSTFHTDTEAGCVVLPKRLFDRASTRPAYFMVSLVSRGSAEIMSIGVESLGWNALLCEFFGGAPDSAGNNDEVSPIEIALRRRFADRLLENITVLMRAYGLGDWRIADTTVAVEADDILSIEFAVTFGENKSTCRVVLAPALIRRLWKRLVGNESEQNSFVSRRNVEMTLTAEMSFDRMRMDRILSHIDGEVMIVGDAFPQKVRLLCNGVLACEGVLTERNGRYAIEITAVCR